MPPGAPCHQRDAPGERFRLRHALKLGLFQQPIFDIERFLLRKAHVLADARRAAHHIDRVDVKLRSNAGRRFVLGEGQHADSGDEIDDRVGVAHRRRVRVFATLIIGGVLGPVVGERLVERGDHCIEIAGGWVVGQHERADLRAQEMIRAGRPKRGQRFEILRIDELQHGWRVREVADLALACGNVLANGGQELRRNIAPVRPRQRLDARPAEGCALRLCAEPLSGLVDHLQRESIAFLRRRRPGEQPVAAEHDALHVRIGLSHRAELEPKVEARPLPRQKAKLSAIDLFRERFCVFARGDRNDGVGVNVIDMAVRDEAVQRCVDRGCARIEVEGAMIVERDHLVLVLEAAIDRFEAQELVHIERREAVELHRADVAARALDPKDFSWRARQRIGRGQLGGRVAAAEIGDAQVAAKQVRPIEQEARFIEGSRMLVVPEIGQWSVETNLVAAHGPVLSMRCVFSPPLGKGSQSVNVSARLRSFGERLDFA